MNDNRTAARRKVGVLMLATAALLMGVFAPAGVQAHEDACEVFLFTGLAGGPKPNAGALTCVDSSIDTRYINPGSTHGVVGAAVLDETGALVATETATVVLDGTTTLTLPLTLTTNGSRYQSAEFELGGATTVAITVSDINGTVHSTSYRAAP